MKINQYWVILTIDTVIFSSCSMEGENELSRPEGTCDTLRLYPNKSEEISIKEIIKQTKFIPLETHEEGLIGMIHCIKYFNGKFFIHDETKVTVFDHQGRFLGNLGSLGRGPEEYTSCDEFIIDKFNGHLIISNHLTGRDLIYFDSTLKFLYKKRYNENVESILPMKDESYCLYFGNRFQEEHDHYIKLTDTNFETKDNLIPKSDEIDHSISQIFHGTYLYKGEVNVVPMFS